MYMRKQEPRTPPMTAARKPAAGTVATVSVIVQRLAPQRDFFQSTRPTDEERQI